MQTRMDNYDEHYDENYKEQYYENDDGKLGWKLS